MFKFLKNRYVKFPQIMFDLENNQFIFKLMIVVSKEFSMQLMFNGI